jgi:hypothetical protein
MTVTLQTANEPSGRGESIAGWTSEAVQSSLTGWTAWDAAHSTCIASLENNLSRDEPFSQLNVFRAIRSTALLLAPLLVLDVGGHRRSAGDPLVLHHEWIFVPIHVDKVGT